MERLVVLVSLKTYNDFLRSVFVQCFMRCCLKAHLPQFVLKLPSLFCSFSSFSAVSAKLT